MAYRIEDLVVGSGYQLNRRVTGIPNGTNVISATLIVKDKESTSDGSALINVTITGTQTVEGNLVDNGSTSGVAVFHIDLSGTNTGTLSAGREYYYRIDINSSFAGVFALEEGVIATKIEVTDVGFTVATTARKTPPIAGTRMGRLVDEYLDTILHEFRQLRVWDEHARRSSSDPKTFLLTYQNWNGNFQPMIVDGNNNTVQMSLVQIDYDRGSVVVSSDDGNQDYFVTYEFDLFPPEQLMALVNLTLQEINSSAEPGTHLTAYQTVDGAPLFWDGPLVLGAAAKAFKRLSTDGMLWKNFLIWQDGSTGHQIAGDSCQYYQTNFDSVRMSVKRGQFLAGPTGAYDMFRNMGFGSINPYSGKFRGLRVNRMATY